MNVKYISYPQWLKRWSFVFCCVAVWCGTGCATLARWTSAQWSMDYDSAERRATNSDREMLIWFTDARPGRPDPLQPVWKSNDVANLAREYTRCMLFKSHEPDRRYVAQFGVARAPALIVIHQDGTYHAREGAMTADAVAQFLTKAIAPGQQAMADPLIPRRARYVWQHDLESAQSEAVEAGRPLLIVYHRLLSNDWRSLSKLLERREVCQRFSEMAHCRIKLWNPLAKTAATPFGDVRLPAFVVVEPDGAFDVLEMPMSPDVVVQFTDQRGQPGTSREPVSLTAEVEP